MRLFVSETYLKTITPAAGNIDVADLLPHVTESQNRVVQEILGSKFYDELIDEAHTLTDNETALLIVIRPYLAWQIIYDALPFLHYKIKPKGLIKIQGESNSSSDLDELKYIRSELKNKAEQYGQRLQDYLYKNKNLFPSYKNYDCPLAPNKNTTFDCDVAFDEEVVSNVITTSQIQNYLYGHD